ncbi:hypothetical protein [Frankia sp. AgW1.1]|uniref:hypothetical protein n=1 Tax=Frankia sp. AgW1.1 TaxID=1836971 RepID=UPI00193177FF|nr:hypothetical protein [Frankia sp. AgW1.1]MBL7494389.1 hypothetical protein [Frankia sp. AgW1.1]
MSGLEGTVGTCSNDGCNATVWVAPSKAEVHANNQPCPATGQWATVPPLLRPEGGAE